MFYVAIEKIDQKPRFLSGNTNFHACMNYVYQALFLPNTASSMKLVERGGSTSLGFMLLVCVCFRYAVDFIILTAGVQVLSAISNYFWLLWLLVSKV